MNEQERAAFEAWATDNGEYPKAVERDSAGNYRLLKVHTDWIAWQARAALAAQQVPADTAIQQLQEQKDGAYLERNRCVAALARMAIALGQRAGRAKTAIDGWDPAWHGCIYIDLPTGQVSWHYHESQSGLFNDLPEYAGRWDGHDTPTKYERLAAAFPVLAAAPQAPAVPLKTVCPYCESEWVTAEQHDARLAAMLGASQPAEPTPLTRAQVDACWGGLMPSGHGKSRYDIARAIEAAHGIRAAGVKEQT